MTWFGADPGGKRAFGVALLYPDGQFRTGTVSCADEAVAWINEPIDAAGVDAPLWWSSGMSSDRAADQFIRKRHKVHPGTVQTANSLKGAALVQGQMTVVRLRERIPQLAITEAHPKALLKATGVDGWHSAVQKFNLASNAEPSEHERDALLAAVAAREGFCGRWQNDLARIRNASEQDPLRLPTGPIHYWWPFS